MNSIIKNLRAGARGLGQMNVLLTDIAVDTLEAMVMVEMEKLLVTRVMLRIHKERIEKRLLDDAAIEAKGLAMAGPEEPTDKPADTPTED